jgi:hypothetical protein
MELFCCPQAMTKLVQREGLPFTKIDPWEWLSSQNRIAKKLSFKVRWQLAAHPGHIKRVATENFVELVDNTMRLPSTAI